MFAGGLAVATIGLTVASLYVFSTIVNNVRNAGKREGIMYRWALGYAEVLVEAHHRTSPIPAATGNR
jgi:hypothetical protein